MKLQAPSLLTVLIFLFLSFQTSISLLTRGSSLSVEDNSHVLNSPDKTFTCGFYSIDDENAYWFSVWFTNSSDRTVVWMANRDRPVNGQGSRVSLRRNGAMVLTDVDGTVIWMTNTTSADRAELLDSGNLVLKDLQGKILWQSFDFPTDTLLPNQYLTKNTKLISKLGRGDFGSGFYTFYFDNDNVLRLIYDGPDTSSVYWPNPDWDVFQNGRTNAIDMGFGIKRRLTMDYDGNLRLYSLNVNGSWMISYEALRQQCNVHGICGKNGICVYTPEPKCSCPPGYEVTEPGNWNKGCKPKFNRTCSNTQQVKFIELPHVDFYGYDLNFSRPASLNSCMKLCLDDCRCEAFSHRMTGEGRCYTKSVLFNGLNTPNFPGTIYLKLPLNVEASEPTSLVGTDLVCPSSVNKVVKGTSSMYDTAVKRIRWAYLYGFAIAIGAIEVIFFVAGDGDEEETELKRFVRVVKTKIQCVEDSWIEDIADPRMNGKFSKNQVAALVGIATLYSYAFTLTAMGSLGLFILLIFAPTMGWAQAGSKGLQRLSLENFLAVEKESDLLGFAKWDIFFWILQGVPQDDECNHLVHWTFKQLKQEGLKKIIDEFVEEKLDRMMKVALLCMADDRNARPPMSFYLDMMNQQHQVQIMRQS
ncbi:hypothetical protein EZV62_016521 [Acer yangbiense]|uniref:non-specific serine/threonine protein kinase n=1 Tax=Acer yangbiense TaxID=1000413 RepID=A0A5C7HR48_9ROSI|nr:hypothetical protein EZV62_016521 [Acer yangbiense]